MAGGSRHNAQSPSKRNHKKRINHKKTASGSGSSKNPALETTPSAEPPVPAIHRPSLTPVAPLEQCIAKILLHRLGQDIARLYSTHLVRICQNHIPGLMMEVVSLTGPGWVAANAAKEDLKSYFRGPLSMELRQAGERVATKSVLWSYTAIRHFNGLQSQRLLPYLPQLQTYLASLESQPKPRFQSLAGLGPLYTKLESLEKHCSARVKRMLVNTGQGRPGSNYDSYVDSITKSKPEVLDETTPVAVSAAMPPVTSYFALKMKSEEMAASLTNGATPETIMYEASPARRRHPVNVMKQHQSNNNSVSSAGRTPISNVFGSSAYSESPSTSRSTSSVASPKPNHRPSFSLSIPPPQINGVTPVQSSASPSTAPHDASTFAALTPTAGSSQRQPLPDPELSTSNVSPELWAQIISARWHDQSDSELQTSVQDAVSADWQPSLDDSRLAHTYNTVIRVLSSSLEKLNDRHMELETRWKRRIEAERARRREAEARIRALKPPVPEDMARRILNAVFGEAEQASGSDAPGNLSLDDSALLDSLQQAMTDTFSPPPRSDSTFSMAIPHIEPPTPVQHEEEVDRVEGLSPTSSVAYSVGRNGTLKSMASSIKSEKSVDRQDTVKQQPDKRGAWATWFGGRPRKRTQSVVSDGASVFSEVADPKSTRPVEEGKSAGTAVKDSGGSDQSTSASIAPRKASTTRGMWNVFGLANPGPSTEQPISPSSGIASPLKVPQGFNGSPTTATSLGVDPSIHPLSSSVSSRAPSIVSTFAASDMTHLRPPRPPSHLRAIFNSTRIMTNDPGSILVDGGREAGDLIQRLAMELVRNAREGGLQVDDVRSNASRARPPSESGTPEDRDAGGTVKAIVAPSNATGMTAAASLGQALAGPSTKTPRRVASRPARVSGVAAIASPLISAFSRPSRKNTLSINAAPAP
ncbi:hypothetical protein M407DRAFT_7633, partial [Tulasnella calospora MUT 4182]